MKRFTLGTIEWGHYTITLFSFYYSGTGFGIDLLKIVKTYYTQHGFYDEWGWHLLQVDYYKQLAIYQTTRFDIILWGKWFSVKRPVPESDELPF